MVESSELQRFLPSLRAKEEKEEEELVTGKQVLAPSDAQYLLQGFLPS